MRGLVKKKSPSPWQDFHSFLLDDTHRLAERFRLAPELFVCIGCTEASTTEKPDVGKQHVRDCAGGVG
jgi:hypothetical protein